MNPFLRLKARKNTVKSLKIIRLVKRKAFESERKKSELKL